MLFKILVCDDEKHIVTLVKSNLERQQFEVVTALDGKEALEQIRTEKPDLVILDIFMPYVDGLEVLRSIRNNPETEDLIVILITAKWEDRNRYDAYKAGASEYVTEPFAMNDLVGHVKNLLATCPA